MGWEIICCKGSGTNDSITITESDFNQVSKTILSDKQELETTLSVLRKILETKKVNGTNFICPDNDNFQYRFVLPEADKKTENYSDRILAKISEDYIDFKKILLKNKKQILLTNTIKKKKPDLIGFATNFWSNGKLRVSCRLKKSDDTTKTANKDKFEPILLENVVPTNEGISLHYENVCICCKDSIIEFPIRSWGTVGFEYKSQLASGEVICQNAVHWATGDKNLFGETCIDSWSTENGDKNIVIEAIENVGEIDTATKVKYQKLTFTTRDMLAWKNLETNTIIDSNTPKKNTLKSNRLSAPTALQVKANSADKQYVIYGDDVTPGTIIKGDDTTVHYGRWCIEECNPWENPEGIVTIFLFVFSSLEKAKAYIDRYNILPPNEQANIWGLN